VKKPLATQVLLIVTHMFLNTQEGWAKTNLLNKSLEVTVGV